MLDSIFGIIKNNSKLGAIVSNVIFVISMIALFVVRLIMGIVYFDTFLLVELLLFILIAVLLFIGKDFIAKIISIIVFIIMILASIYTFFNGWFMRPTPFLMRLYYIFRTSLFIIILISVALSTKFKMNNAKYFNLFLFFGWIVLDVVFRIVFYSVGLYYFMWFDIFNFLAIIFLPLFFMFSYIHSFCNE